MKYNEQIEIYDLNLICFHFYLLVLENFIALEEIKSQTLREVS